MTSSIFKKTLAKAVLFIFSFITILSFSSKAGGITFEIYLNNKLLLKNQWNKVVAGSPDLQLDDASSDDNLRIYFTACHATGKTRSVGIKDENNNLLKEWTFTNSTSSDLSMTIPVKEILALKKGKSTGTLTIYYFSPDQFPNGQMLASVQPGKKNTVYHQDGKKKYLPVVTAGIFTLAALGLFIRRNV
ncbi:MAG: hypothetical protein ABUL44_01715 [Flavobacterium sp.]